MNPVPNRIITCFMTFRASDICSDCSSSITSVLKHSLFASIVMVSLSVSVFNSMASTNAVSDISDIVVLRSTTGRYVVTSTNSVWNTYLMRWIEMVDQKVESLIDIKMPFDSRLIRIVVSDKHSGSSEVTWSQGYVQGRFIQQLNIYDYLHSDIAQAEVALCGLFLNGYVVNQQSDTNGDNSNNLKRRISNTSLRRAPSWLALGMARNLYPTYRAVNSEELLKIYDKGQLESVTELLQKFTDSKKDNELNGYVCGMFVLWLSKLPEHAVIFDKLFSIIANDKPLTATELSSIINNCDSVKTMEILWSEWVSRQKRMVYEPGVITPRVVERLKGMLVVTPKQCSIADGPVITADLEFKELISQRKESWMKACARQKIIQLKFMFVGRGDDMNQVIDLYCDFLSGLEKRKSKRHLRKLLNNADEAMKSFVEKYGDKDKLKDK